MSRKFQHGFQLAALTLATLGAQGAQAVEFQAGDWTVSIGGDVNAYYTTGWCSGSNVAGTALAGKALGCAGESSRTSIGNGLLPDALITTVKSKQGDYDVEATIGIMAHVATSSGLAANSGVDVRQAYGKVGNAQIGTFKLGRDYGVFGSNAILTDMTLFGAGAPVQATQRGRVALGHIGAGYTYLNSYGQLTWTAPTVAGFTFTGAVVSPVDSTAGFDSKAAPQVQAQLGYAGSYDGGGYKAWVGGKAQKFYPQPLSGNTDSFTMAAGEAGAAVDYGPFGLLGNVQYGRGIGILTDGDQGPVRGFNYLLQGTYKATEKLKVGISWGVNRNLNPNTSDVVLNPNGVGSLRHNTNLTLGSYYALTKSVTLVGELSQTRSKDSSGATARLNGIALGGILFF